MENKMAEVAKILGVELDEEFMDQYGDRCKITLNDGLMCLCDGKWKKDDTLEGALLGNWRSIKIKEQENE